VVTFTSDQAMLVRQEIDPVSGDSSEGSEVVNNVFKLNSTLGVNAT
jgi:hypothetical protein